MVRLAVTLMGTQCIWGQAGATSGSVCGWMAVSDVGVLECVMERVVICESGGWPWLGSRRDDNVCLVQQQHHHTAQH